MSSKIRPYRQRSHQGQDENSSRQFNKQLEKALNGLDVYKKSDYYKRLQQEKETER